ncbi:MAG: BlaI/MecI/CopY family transcriptional regulator [Myxococcales bacterium FL481]|nr:MAG: BlaI/MecI/CopY family transcriptional regulator [Myxococcales bacterium FL481]
MARTASTAPTEAEMSILVVLWERGPSTVRTVHEQLHHQRETGYTTTLKHMQIMLDKGWLRRDESTRSHVYEAAVSRTQVQNQMAGRLIDSVFSGSAGGLIQRVLSSRRPSSNELEEIQRFLDEAKRRSGRQ